MILTEEEFSLLKKRNKIILTRLYNHYSEDIITYFYIRTYGNHSLADDLMQETFCAIIEYAPRIKSKKYLTSTIFFIARNKLADHQRTIIREKKKNTYLKEQMETPHDIHDELYNKQKLFLFNLAVDSLNPLYRKIYEMYYIKDEDIKAISNHFNRTYKAIENILSRIRKTLKSQIMRHAKKFFEEG